MRKGLGESGGAFFNGKEGRVDFRKNLRLREDWWVFEKLLIPLHHVLSLFLPGKLHLPFLAILRKELQ